MDETKTYSKVCDCKEIQDGWKFRQGDFFTIKHPKGGYGKEGYGKVHIASFLLDVKNREEFEEYYQDKKPPYKYVFLPRQDQIQKMFGWNLIKLFSFFFDFAHDSMVEENGIGNKPKENPLFDSMEQLWLAFYMQEKHKKIWNGKKWAKEKK